MGIDFADAPDYIRANALGTAELLAAIGRAGVGRLVLASSMVVYGEGRYVGSRGDVRPGPRRMRRPASGACSSPATPSTGEILTPALTDEDAPLDPRSVYAASKLAQEQLASIWAAEDRRRASRCSGTTTSTGRACRATPRTRALRRSSGPRSSAAIRRACSRTAVSAATSSTSTTSRARTSPRPRMDGHVTLRHRARIQHRIGHGLDDPRCRHAAESGARRAGAGRHR